MSELYPLQFRENLKEKIWGGDAMGRLLGKGVTAGQKIGESWEVSDHGVDSSVVCNGPLAGMSLHEIFSQQKEALMGRRLAQKYADVFPLLVKFLDARENLSVQVHPDDEQARELEVDELGKTECWYILHAEPGATIIKGVARDLSREEFSAAIAEGGVMDLLDEFPITTGDFLFLPAGTIHAICSGTVIAEIQQNSDTTYRVYDYGRLGLDGQPRDLHIDKTLAVADLRKNSQRCETPVPLECEEAQRWRLNKCDKFWVDKICLDDVLNLTTDDEVQVVMVVGGEGELCWGDDGQRQKLSTGMSLLVPAALERYSLHGNLEVLLSAPV